MAQKKWRVIKNTVSETVTGVDVGNQKMAFGRNGTFTVSDPQLARDIDKVYGRRGNQQVAVVPANDPTREIGHTYSFGSSPKYAKAWDAFEKRRKSKVKSKVKKRGT